MKTVTMLTAVLLAVVVTTAPMEPKTGEQIHMLAGVRAMAALEQWMRDNNVVNESRAIQINGMNRREYISISYYPSLEHYGSLSVTLGWNPDWDWTIDGAPPEVAELLGRLLPTFRSLHGMMTDANHLSFYESVRASPMNSYVWLSWGDYAESGSSGLVDNTMTLGVNFKEDFKWPR